MRLTEDMVPVFVLGMRFVRTQEQWEVEKTSSHSSSDTRCLAFFPRLPASQSKPVHCSELVTVASHVYI